MFQTVPRHTSIVDLRLTSVSIPLAPPHLPHPAVPPVYSACPFHLADGQKLCSLICMAMAGSGDNCGDSGNVCQPFIPAPMAPGICDYPKKGTPAGAAAAASLEIAVLNATKLGK